MSEDKQDKTARQRIIREQIKDGQTSHWDLDLLSREELEELMKSREAEAEGKANEPDADAGDENKPES